MMNSLLLTGVLCVAFSRSYHSLAISNTIRTDGLQQRLKQLTQGGGIILLDGDNIRGKTKFRLSKEDLCRDVEEWMSEWGLFGLVTLMYDHASQHSAYFLPKSGLAVVFSGPGRSADDVISRDVAWFQRALQKDVVVVTEDNNLKKRCRTISKGRASARGKQKEKKPKQSHVQLLTTNQQKLLTIMEENQKNKDLESGEKNNNDFAMEKASKDLIDNGTDDIITALKSERKQKDLTFVSSPLFADMILASFNERSTPSATLLADSNRDLTDTAASASTPHNSAVKISDEDCATAAIEATPVSGSVPSESVIPVGVKGRSSIPTKTRNFESLSDPSVSATTTLEKKNSQYNLEVALLRREVELRKQISGYETSLLRCDRKKAVKIRVKVSNLRIMLEDIIVDAANARNSYAETAVPGDGGGGEVKDRDGGSNGIKNSAESVVNTPEYVSVVDRGTELLAKLLSDGRPEGSIEETWERVILAERMRFNLQITIENSNVIVPDNSNSDVTIATKNISIDAGDVKNVSTTGQSPMTPAETYVDYINKNYIIAKRVPMVVKA